MLLHFPDPSRDVIESLPPKLITDLNIECQSTITRTTPDIDAPAVQLSMINSEPLGSESAERRVDLQNEATTMHDCTDEGVSNPSASAEYQSPATCTYTTVDIHDPQLIQVHIQHDLQENNGGFRGASRSIDDIEQTQGATHPLPVSEQTLDVFTPDHDQLDYRAAGLTEDQMRYQSSNNEEEKSQHREHNNSQECAIESGEARSMECDTCTVEEGCQQVEENCETESSTRNPLTEGSVCMPETYTHAQTTGTEVVREVKCEDTVESLNACDEGPSSVVVLVAQPETPESDLILQSPESNHDHLFQQQQQEEEKENTMQQNSTLSQQELHHQQDSSNAYLQPPAALPLEQEELVEGDGASDEQADQHSQVIMNQETLQCHLSDVPVEHESEHMHQQQPPVIGWNHEQVVITGGTGSLDDSRGEQINQLTQLHQQSDQTTHAVSIAFFIAIHEYVYPGPCQHFTCDRVPLAFSVVCTSHPLIALDGRAKLDVPSVGLPRYIV